MSSNQKREKKVAKSVKNRPFYQIAPMTLCQKQEMFIFLTEGTPYFINTVMNKKAMFKKMKNNREVPFRQDIPSLQAIFNIGNKSHSFCRAHPSFCRVH